jgi:hypothetical protein
MPINHPVTKLTALVLGGAAVAAATQTSAQALSAQPGARAVNAAAGQGNPTAEPPILPQVPLSERAAIRRGEARKQQEFSYHLPASARYSTTEMDVFAAEGYGRALTQEGPHKRSEYPPCSAVPPRHRLPPRPRPCLANPSPQVMAKTARQRTPDPP